MSDSPGTAKSGSQEPGLTQFGGVGALRQDGDSPKRERGEDLKLMGEENLLKQTKGVTLQPSEVAGEVGRRREIGKLSRRS